MTSSQFPIVSVLVLSIMTQAAAAIMAIRLIGITGRRSAWSLIAMALVLMAVRRVVPLYHLLAGDVSLPPHPLNETIGFALSAMMAIGISQVAPVFLERNRAEETMRRLNRELRAISSCNQVLIRAENEHTLISDICRIISNEAGYRMAWVGYAENDDAKTVRPVASAGVEDGYLSSANITWADTERGRGPTGTAARSGKSVCIQDFTIDPRAAPWRAGALHRGYRSSIALPLKDENANTFGVLTIYSTEPNAFPPDEIRLLDELAGDLAFGITTLRARSQRQQAERALAESAERFRTLADYTYDWEYWEGPDRTIWYVTPSCERVTGFSPAEFMGDPMLIYDIVYPDDQALMRRHIADAVHEDLASLDFRIVRKDGEVRWIAHGCRTVYWRDGRFMGRRTSNRDITERKRAEEALRLANERFRRFVESNIVGIVIATADGAVLEANDYYLNLIGVTRQELEQGKVDWRAVTPPEYRSLDEQALRELREQGVCTPYEKEYLRRDGSRIPVFLTGTILPGPGEQIVAFYLDITERRRAEEALRQRAEEVERLLDVVPAAVLVASDPACSIITGNARANTLYEVMPGANVSASAFPEVRRYYGLDGRELSADELPMQITAATNQEVRDVEFEVLLPSGRTVSFLGAAVPLRNERGEVRGCIGAFMDITDRKRAEGKVKESEKKFKSLIDSAPWGIYMSAGLEQKGEYMNPTATRLFGYTLDEVPTVSDWWSLAYPDEKYRNQIKEEWERKVEQAIKTHSAIEPMETVVTCKNGSKKNILWGFVSTGVQDWSFSLDLTDRKKAEEALRLVNERFRRFVESNIVGIVTSTPGGAVLEANDYFLNLIGLTRLDLEQGKVNWRAITPPEWLPADELALRELREHGVCTPYEMEYLRRDGTRVPVLLAATMLPGPGEQVAGFCLDLTERKAAMAQIQLLAHYDELTGLPKRSLLKDRWEMALAAAERNYRRVALLFLDIDHFKNVNDSLGHATGDQLLRAVAERLKACLRHHDTLARTGGDEFIVVLPNLQMVEEAAQVAQKLRDAVQSPFRVDGHELFVTLSLGISLYPDDGSDFETLSRNADAALYEAKETGRDRYHFFTAELDALAGHRLRLENALRRALAHEEFELHYQPQWDMAEERIVGLEALLRWRDPEQGWVAPADFIPLAEKNHLILPLGEWVIRAACRQNSLWQAAGLPPVPVAVNISSLQFIQPAFRQLVAEALDDTQLQPKYLELELTESVLMENAEATIATAHELKAMGLHIAIDDFGTGYSSLSYLKRLPIDKLKIAQSFVRDIATDPNDAMIIRAIIGLAADLQLKVLAEGVETQEQCDFLRKEQCLEAQGYHFSKPLPADQVAALLRMSA